MGSQVPSPTHVSKSHYGGKVPTFEPQETIEVWLMIIKVGSCSTQLSTLVPSLTFMKCCHVGIHVILETQDFGTLCEVTNHNFHALNSSDCTYFPRVTKGHFTHETESPLPFHFENSCWWKRWSHTSLRAFRTGTQILLFMFFGVKSIVAAGLAWQGMAACVNLT